MEKYVRAKRYGKAWHMFVCPRAELCVDSPCCNSRWSLFSPPVIHSHTHISNAGEILCFHENRVDSQQDGK